MSQLKSYTKIPDTDLSVRAMNVINNTLPKVSSRDLTLAEVIDNKDKIFANPNCTERTKKEITQLIIEYIM